MALSPQGLLDLLVGWLRSPPPVGDDEHPRPVEPVEPTTRMLERCGAWCGWASMVTDAAIKRDVAFARSLGLTRLDIIVNDHSAARAERIFDTYKRSRIVALGHAATQAGLEVNLMSWIMPHERYLRDGMPLLVDLLEQVDGASVMFDAEEPWTQARRPMAYDTAASIVADGMRGHRWGVTGIGYASSEKLGALVRASAYMVPQAYATASSGLDPSHAPVDLSARWKKIFGARDLVVGLAAYRQTGIPGYTPDQAIRAAFTSAGAAKPVAVVWWSLGQIRQSTAVARAIRDVVALANAQSSPRVPTPQEIT